MSKLRFLFSLITKENDYQVEQAAAALQTHLRAKTCKRLQVFLDTPLLLRFTLLRRSWCTRFNSEEGGTIL